MAKCHVLTVTKRGIPTASDQTLHGQVLQRVSSAKCHGVELTEHLHWEKYIHKANRNLKRCPATLNWEKYIHKANKNLKRCPATLHSHYHKSLVRPVLEYASVVWDPHQENLKSDIEMVQGRAARRICHGFSHSPSASALITRLELQQVETS